jgi:hypothetical protein
MLTSLNAITLAVQMGIPYILVPMHGDPPGRFPSPRLRLGFQ